MARLEGKKIKMTLEEAVGTSQGVIQDWRMGYPNSTPPEALRAANLIIKRALRDGELEAGRFGWRYRVVVPTDRSSGSKSEWEEMSDELKNAGL